MNAEAAAQQVRVHINRETYRSPNPTTGEALYDLADIPKQQDLYREVDGNNDDQRIPRDGTEVRLTQDEHFYSQKVFDIVVNGEGHELLTRAVTYARVVELYLGDGGAPSNEYLVKYSHGPAENPTGTLAPGQKVRLKDGMRFRVAGTGES
ncbi:MAG: multiubiquitin domain-containing protein [Hyphomonadaceae bacterium]|nr:multiubiquitin domain-containing protein [Hyphomonadaceae bacterium]